MRPVVTRFLDTSALQDHPGADTRVALRYQYQRGTLLRYRSRLSVQQISDAGPRFSSRTREDVELRTTIRVLDTDDEDGGFFVVMHQEPLEHVIDGVSRKTSGKQVLYFKQDAWGEILESSGADAVNVLLLPREPLFAGAEWSEVQRLIPPQRQRPVEVSGSYRVQTLDLQTITLDYEGDEAIYRGDTPTSMGNVYSVKMRGTFEFDLLWGVSRSLALETTVTSKEGEYLFECVSVYRSCLSDD